MMKKLLTVLAAATVTACAGDADEPRLSRLSDGGYELSIPQSYANHVAAASGFPFQAFVAGRAKSVCPAAFQATDTGMRKRPEYADPEQVWRIDCK
jgi:hypothetical protein